MIKQIGLWCKEFFTPKQIPIERDSRYSVEYWSLRGVWVAKFHHHLGGIYYLRLRGNQVSEWSQFSDQVSGFANEHHAIRCCEQHRKQLK